MTIDTMDLAREEPSDVIDLDASTVGDLSPGERLQIRAGSPGNTITLLDEVVPEGKNWKLWIHVRGDETTI